MSNNNTNLNGTTNKKFRQLSQINLNERILVDIDLQNIVTDAISTNYLSSYQLLREDESLPNVIKMINNILRAFGAQERPWYEDFEELNQDEQPIQISETTQITITDGILTQTSNDTSDSMESQKIYLTDRSLKDTFYELILDSEDSVFSTIKYQKDELTDEQVNSAASAINMTDTVTGIKYQFYVENEQLTQIELT